MAYDIPSYIVKPPTKGQRSDLPPYAIPEDAALELKNFLRRQGVVKTRPGFASKGTTLGDRPTGIYLFQHHSGNPRLLATTETKWWNWDTSAGDWDDITPVGNPLTGSTGTHQLFRVFYKSGTSYVVGVNGYTDAPIKWDGTSAEYSDVGGTPGNAKCLGVIANRMLMANFSNSPLKIDVSDSGDFESGWGSVQVVQLADTQGEILAIQEMGNLVGFVYKSDAIYSCIATAALSPFKFELKMAGIAGPLSPTCVIPTPWGSHFILGTDFNVYSYDGVSYTALGDHVKYAIEPLINKDKAALCWGYFDVFNNEAWFFFPESGTIKTTRAVVIKRDGTVWPIKFDNIEPSAGANVYFTNIITIGDMTQPLSYYTNPLADYTTYQKLQILGDYEGQVYQEQGNLEAGSPFECKYKTGMYAPSETRKFVTVGEIDVYAKKTGGNQETNVKLLYSEDGGLNPKESDAQVINLGQTGPHVLGERKDSRYFGIELSADVQERIELETMKVSGIERGSR